MPKTVKPELIISILALVVAITSTVAAVYFSRIKLRTDILPTVVLVYSNTDDWEITNIGNGPALNVMVAHQNHDSDTWELPTRLYPLPRDGKVAIPWVGKNPDKIAISYSDVHNNQYTSITDDDLTKIYEDTYRGTDLPQWEELEVQPVWQR